MSNPYQELNTRVHDTLITHHKLYHFPNQYEERDELLCKTRLSLHKLETIASLLAKSRMALEEAQAKFNIISRMISIYRADEKKGARYMVRGIAVFVLYCRHGR